MTELDAQIEELRRTADDLAALSRSLVDDGAGLEDAQGTGTDEAAIVTATIRGGDLVDLTIAENWRGALGTRLLGRAVFTAMSAARAELEKQWQKSVEAGTAAAAATTEQLKEPSAARRPRPTMAQLSSRVDAILNAIDEQDAYLEALEAAGADSTYPSPAGYFTVHSESGRVTALDPDDYALTFASPSQIALDIRAVFDGAAGRAGVGDDELAQRFPAIAELMRRQADDE